MPDATVIVVNWNSGALLARCVRHLMAQTVPPARVLVVDNASTDESLAQLPSWDRLVILPMSTNCGFAAANNAALDHAETEFVALLNPDAFAAPDWLERLLCAARSWPQTAAFGSRQLLAGSAGYLDGIGDCYHLSGLAWREANGQAQSEAHLHAGEIFAPCAAAALYRRAALADVGGFDERYFCYMEDVDLGFRLRLAGHHARYVPDAVVEHVGGAASGGGRSDFSVFHGHRNLVWTFVKNMPGLLFWALLPLHVAANVVAMAVFVARGQARIILHSKWQALKGLPTVWRQRQEIQRRRTTSARDIWRALDKRLWPRP